MNELREVWESDWAAAELTPRTGYWDEVVKAYAVRPYHNLQHAFEVRELVSQLGGAPATRLAAWYHDVVYDPRASDNEERSAELARSWLADGGAPETLAEEIIRLILLTRHHMPKPEDVHGQILCDADLAVLSVEPAEYVKYVAAIRQEYSFVPDREFWAGRLAVLERLLARPQIYHRPEMRDRDFLAVVNMRTETGWLQIQLGN